MQNLRLPFLLHHQRRKELSNKNLQKKKRLLKLPRRTGKMLIVTMTTSLMMNTTLMPCWIHEKRQGGTKKERWRLIWRMLLIYWVLQHSAVSGTLLFNYLISYPTNAAHSSSDITALLSFQPRTKEDFIKLSDQFINLLVKPHQSKPLYPFFAEHHARALALSLKDVEVRKVASGLTTLANEKQKEQRDKASGKKKVKPKTAMKPGLGPAKASSKWVFYSWLGDTLVLTHCFSFVRQGWIRAFMMRLWMILEPIQMTLCETLCTGGTRFKNLDGLSLF